MHSHLFILESILKGPTADSYRCFWFRLGLILGVAVGVFADCRQAVGQASNPGSDWAKRIVGGVTPEGFDYPWMVALVRADDPIAYRGFFAGATLIHPKWLLTAAHAVAGKQASEIDALLGAQNLMDIGGWRRVSVRSIVVHPRFANREGAMGYDLALLELSERIENVTVPGLWPHSDAMLEGRLARTMGWGRTATRGFRSAFLLEVIVPLVNSSEVDAVAVYGEPLSPDTLLAGSAEPKRDTCDGDSGGPLLVRDDRLNIFWLVGVIAGGSNRGCAVDGAFGLYTKVTTHRDWIESVIVRQFGDWAATYRLDGPDQDSDGDGFSNFREYARRSHPLDPDSYPQLVARIGSVNGVRYAELGGLVRLDAKDVVFDVEFSEDLNIWNSIDRLTATSHMAGGWGGFQWLASTALSDAPLGFYRLREIQVGKAPLLVLNPGAMISETVSQAQ